MSTQPIKNCSSNNNNKHIKLKWEYWDHTQRLQCWPEHYTWWPVLTHEVECILLGRTNAGTRETILENLGKHVVPYSSASVAYPVAAVWKLNVNYIVTITSQMTKLSSQHYNVIDCMTILELNYNFFLI